MAGVIIAEQDFKKLIEERGRNLLALAARVSKCQSIRDIIPRPFLGEFLSQSAQVEELLDAYGAGTNWQWGNFRSLTAAIKGFSDVSYELLHIQHVLPGDHLRPTGKDFIKATDETLELTSDILLQTAKQLLIQAEHLGLDVHPEDLEKISYAEELPPGRLEHLCERREIKAVSETVTLLATAFLNLAAHS